MNEKKLFGLAALAALSLVVFSILVSAFSMPPVVQIGASSNSTTLNSVITAVAVDFSGLGIASVKIYEDGNLVKQCSSSTCSYVAFHTTPGVRSYYAAVSDNKGSSTNSNTITVDFKNSAPILNYIGNKSINDNSTLRFTISGYDYNNDSLVYSAAGLPDGAGFNSVSGAFVWTPSSSQSGVYYVNFSVSDGFLTDSEVIAISIADTKAPSYSNLNANPSSPATYAPSQNYRFNATWADNAAVSNVGIEFNGVNYSVSGISGVYSFLISNLKAGTYSYAWYARDSSGNLNKTVSMNYTINKAVPALSLSVLPSNSVASNTLTNVSGLGCSSQLTCKLYRNGAEVNNSDAGHLADGVYSYVYNTTGNENYTATSVSATLYVNSVSPAGDSGDDDEDGKTRTVSDSELLSGYFVYMNVDDRLKFNLCGSPYYIMLTDIDNTDDEAYFKLTPGAQSFVLGESERVELDLSANGVKDILFRVENLDSNRVKIYIKRTADVCGAVGDNTPIVIVSQDLAEKLSFEGKNVNALTYALVFLMFGILLAALAVLLSLLRRKRKK